jgi:hypothetical protein
VLRWATELVARGYKPVVKPVSQLHCHPNVILSALPLQKRRVPNFLGPNPSMEKSGSKCCLNVQSMDLFILGPFLGFK